MSTDTPKTPAMKWSDIVPPHRLGPSYFRGVADVEYDYASPEQRYEMAGIDLFSNLSDCGDCLLGDPEDDWSDEAFDAHESAAMDALAQHIAAAPTDCIEYAQGRKDGKASR